MCFDFAKHGRPKVPIRKLSPSGSIKTEVHAPGFYGFAEQNLFYTCAKRTEKARRRRAFFASLRDAAPQRGALSPAVFRQNRNRQGRRTAVRRIKFPIKVQLCRTFIPLPAPRRRGRPCRAGARGVSFSVSPEPKTYPGGTASPLDECAQRTKFVIVRGFVTGGSMPALSITLSIHAMLRPSFSMTSTPSVSCMTSPLSAPWTAFQ